MSHFPTASRVRPALPKVAAALLMLACASASAQPRLVKDSDVQTCRFVGRVSADSGYGKNNDWKGAAKFAALRRAEGIGASDIVVERYTPVGSFNGVVEARAYACGGGAPRSAEAAPTEARNEE